MRLLLQAAVKLLSGLCDKNSANNITWINILVLTRPTININVVVFSRASSFCQIDCTHRRIDRWLWVISCLSCCGDNDATCHAAPQRNASGVNEHLGCILRRRSPRTMLRRFRRNVSATNRKIPHRTPKSLDYALHSCFRKIFSTRDQVVVNHCMAFFYFSSVSEAVKCKQHRFFQRYLMSTNSLCVLFCDKATAVI